MKKIVRRVFNWVFKEELIEMTKIVTEYQRDFRRMEAALGNLDVSVDIDGQHKHARSWAVISLQGQKSDFIKFVDLGDRDIRDIEHFLRRFDRSKVDCPPTMGRHLRNQSWYKV